ncbi:MAG: hypothetical protein ACK5CW_08900 [Verrucomicrobiota bacterium]
MILRSILSLTCALSLTSCGTAAHWINQATSLVGTVLSPVTNIIRSSEGGTEKQWERSARNGYRLKPAPAPVTAPVTAPTPTP